MIRPCVRCGFCCKQGSCQFGQYDFEKKQCEFLIQIDSDTYSCGRTLIVAGDMNSLQKVLQRQEPTLAPRLGQDVALPSTQDQRT